MRITRCSQFERDSNDLKLWYLFSDSHFFRIVFKIALMGLYIYEHYFRISCAGASSLTEHHLAAVLDWVLNGAWQTEVVWIRPIRRVKKPMHVYSECVCVCALTAEFRRFVTVSIHSTMTVAISVYSNSLQRINKVTICTQYFRPI